MTHTTHSMSAPGVIKQTAIADQHLTDSDTSMNDLLECVQWQLEWKSNTMVNRSLGQQAGLGALQPNNCNVMLILSCIPKPEFAAKMDDVWVTIGFTLYSGDPSDGSIIHDVSSSTVQPIKLTKQAQYQCVLIRDSSVLPTFIDPNSQNKSYPQNIQLKRFTNAISAKIVLIHAGYPLNDTLKHDLGALLSFNSFKSQNQFSDVKLVIVPKESGSMPVEFPTHKVILAARSPVFAKMFEHKMQESATNKVKIDDIKPNVLKEMLTYIYTGQAPGIGDKNMAYDLFYAADKYQLSHLKLLCEQQIISSLRVNNAAHIVQFAHSHNAAVLKRVALRFISKNAMAVRRTREWEQVKQNPEILDEVIQAMHTMMTSTN